MWIFSYLTEVFCTGQVETLIPLLPDFLSKFLTENLRRFIFTMFGKHFIRHLQPPPLPLPLIYSYFFKIFFSPLISKTMGNLLCVVIWWSLHKNIKEWFLLMRALSLPLESKFSFFPVCSLYLSLWRAVTGHKLIFSPSALWYTWRGHVNNKCTKFSKYISQCGGVKFQALNLLRHFLNQREVTALYFEEKKV